MFDISSIQISTPISDKRFIDYLPQFMPKLGRQSEFQSQL